MNEIYREKQRFTINFHSHIQKFYHYVFYNIQLFSIHRIYKYTHTHMTHTLSTKNLFLDAKRNVHERIFANKIRIKRKRIFTNHNNKNG